MNLDSVFAILGILGFLVGIVWLIVNLFRKKQKKIPMIILIAGFSLFLIGLIMGTSAINEKNSKENGYKIVETTKKDKIKQNYYRVTLKNTSEKNIKENLDKIIEDNEGLNSIFIYFHEEPESKESKLGDLIVTYKHAYTNDGAIQIGADESGETLKN